MWGTSLQWLLWLIVRPLVMIVWTWSQILRIFHSRPPIPPVSNRLLLSSASELAKLIRSRKVKCTEVIEAFIERVKEVNPIINAMVENRFDQALQDAAMVDMNLATSTKTEEELARDTPLLGVPITIKESIAVAGMSNNAGVPGRCRVAPKDSTAVASLRAAGAIPLLVSNTPELCVCWETYNPVTGRTNNPYDARLTPGGSSGGEAALISSAASVIGLGSDIGGSGRIPASFCGIFGHKPSSEYISVEGHMPSSDDPNWSKVFVFAPMCRYAEDLPLLFKSSVSDKEKLKELRLDEPVDLRSVKFYYLNKDGSKYTSLVHENVKTALNKAISHIEQTYKVSVNKLEVKKFKHLGQLCFFLLIRLRACHNIFQKSADNLTEWKSVTWECVKWLLGLSPHAFHAINYGLCKNASELCTKRSITDMENCRQSIIHEVNTILGDNGVLLMPTFPKPAHPHMQTYYLMVNSGYLAFANLLDLPATACPIMRDSSGVPVGIQVVAGRGQDRLTLAVAKEFEKAFGGWVPPTGANLMDVKS